MMWNSLAHQKDIAASNRKAGWSLRLIGPRNAERFAVFIPQLRAEL